MLAIETLGALVSALAVWLTARRHPWCWPVALVSVAIYAFIFREARLYSDMLLQGAFAVMIVYGWLRWMQHLDAQGHVRVAPLEPRDGFVHVLIGAAGALALGFFMHSTTDAALPWLDAALAAFSLVAQWWQARRHAAAWLLWIAVDVVYVGLYVHKDLFVTAILYAGFLLLAAWGFKTWRAQAARQRAEAAHAAHG